MKAGHKCLLFYHIFLSVIFLCRGTNVFFNDNGNLVLPGSYNIPWMAGIQDFRTLSLITIPGTHDSMALYGGPEDKCQALSLRDQLRVGVRFLDLKVFGLFDTLYVMHGVMYQRSTFKEVLDTMFMRNINAMLKPSWSSGAHVTISSAVLGIKTLRSSERKRTRRTSQSVLGTLHIVIGLLNIGFGVIIGLSRGDFWWEVFPFWLGATFMIFGITCIVSEKFPSPCLVILNHLRRAQRPSLSALGTLHIMVGLLNIGLGVILLCSISGSSWQMDSTWFPVWLGVLFMIFGIMCIVSEKFPSPCLVILNVILNLAGVGFAIAAIALYSINIGYIHLWGNCGRNSYYYWTTPSPSPDKDMLRERCMEGRELALILKTLCYSPVCCLEKAKGLMQPSVICALGSWGRFATPSVLLSAQGADDTLSYSSSWGERKDCNLTQHKIQTIQIMLGLFNIALGPGRPAFHPMDMAELGASYWLGAVYIVVGIMSILAGQFPSLCLVGFTVSMNIVGGLFAVTGIMMFSAEIQSATFAVFTWNLYGYDSKSRRSLISMDAVTVITAVLQVLMCITFAAMGIKALVNKKKKDKVAEEVEDQKPELKEILMSSPCA
ncbi:B-lymphocyte antigen CD20-like isoform X1 [Lates japonicus]|uniref:B-lymphocyte antigen CD20-like isoform X1 n=1 Tax=Lates japonicus TaxID=270547 RepID=A0AAD3MFR6_LATJO|nr:B-lymphocyte antigen CD20-like isoform X1 [Lates japonicus]